MTANIGTTINVYLDSNHSVQYSPSNQIQVPGDAIDTVIWKAIPPLQFKSSGSGTTNLANIISGKIKFLPSPTAPPVLTDTITMTIDNSNGPPNVSAKVALGIIDTSSSLQPPPVIDGGGSIRNKGTSLWVWELALALLAVLLAGVLVGRTIAAAAEVGPLAGIALGVAAGFVASMMLVRMQANAR